MVGNFIVSLNVPRGCRGRNVEPHGRAACRTRDAAEGSGASAVVAGVDRTGLSAEPVSCTSCRHEALGNCRLRSGALLGDLDLRSPRPEAVGVVLPLDLDRRRATVGVTQQRRNGLGA